MVKSLSLFDLVLTSMLVVSRCWKACGVQREQAVWSLSVTRLFSKFGTSLLIHLDHHHVTYAFERCYRWPSACTFAILCDFLASCIPNRVRFLRRFGPQNEQKNFVDVVARYRSVTNGSKTLICGVRRWASQASTPRKLGCK